VTDSAPTTAVPTIVGGTSVEHLVGDFLQHEWDSQSAGTMPLRVTAVVSEGLEILLAGIPSTDRPRATDLVDGAGSPEEILNRLRGQLPASIDPWARRVLGRLPAAATGSTDLVVAPSQQAATSKAADIDVVDTGERCSSHEEVPTPVGTKAEGAIPLGPASAHPVPRAGTALDDDPPNAATPLHGEDDWPGLGPAAFDNIPDRGASAPGDDQVLRARVSPWIRPLATASGAALGAGVATVLQMSSFGNEMQVAAVTAAGGMAGLVGSFVGTRLARAQGHGDSR